VALTAQLGGCGSAEEVLSLVASTSQQPWFNRIHACAALTRLRALSGTYDRGDARLRLLVDKSLALLPDMEARNLATVIHCFAMLGVELPASQCLLLRPTASG
jgi:hypothetical protein